MPDTTIHDVNETLRRQFEATWLHGQPVPIDRFLPDHDTPSYLATLVELVHIELEFAWKTWSARCHGAETHVPGETEVRPPPIESYLERFAELDRPEVLRQLVLQEYYLRKRFDDQPLLEEYQRRFPDLALSEQTWIEASLPDSGAPPVLPVIDEKLPRFLGNYKLLARLGHGGMGVVYRAYQPQTDRYVALKVIRNDQPATGPPDSKSSLVERFRHEARAAARLEHENIVRVYDVGEIGGQQFYAMRFVDGRSLAELLQDGPLAAKQAAAYLESVARAVQSAHEMDVLHRDLKPQNILIDGKTDRPLVADFGLAKVPTTDSDITRAGEVVGTPSYMAPEQARDAAHVTAAADVYSLGATLYHAITGRPPFQAATAVETLRQAIDDEPLPPSRLVPSLDRDMETICLKCLQKEPARRYVSAGALADDLARYLRGEPILARPLGVVGRSVRWCRRNPLTAAWVAAATFFLCVALVASLVGYLTTSAALTLSEENYRQAREAVDYFCTQASENELLNVPGMQPVRKDLLRHALRHYELFLAQRGDDPSIREELGQTYFRVGRIMEEIESPEQALEAYRQARHIQQALVDQDADDIGALAALGNTLNGTGRALIKMQQYERAGQALESAREVRQRLVDLEPENAEFRRILANTLMNISLGQKALGDFESARQQLHQAQVIRRALLEQAPDESRLRRDFGMGYYNLGTLALDMGDLQKAGVELDTAVRQFRQVHAAAPEDQVNQTLMAVCLRMIGHVLILSSEEQEFSSPAAKAMRNDALQTFDEALRISSRQAVANPSVVDYQRELAALRMEMGTLQLQQEQPAAALKSFQEATVILSPLFQRHPALQRDLAVALRETARIQMEQQNSADAEWNLTQAHEHLKSLVAQHPDDDEYRTELRETLQLLAQLRQTSA